MMLTGPIPATREALLRGGLALDEVDLVEVNEAFAPVPLAWLREFRFDPERVNPNGGAISIGHPVGATGARLVVTALHELERSGGRYALVTMCEGDGMGNATILERL
jgi:acetyl-CoA acetyltransferase